MKRGRISTIVGILVAGSFCSVSQAALNLVTQLPTVTSEFITVNYDAGTHILTANGYSDQVDTASQTYNSFLDTFSLSASIANDGTIDTGGSFALDVYGDIGSGSELLFHSDTLSDFSSSADDKFEFIFSRPGTGAGSLSSPGSDIGVILDGRQIAAFTDPSYGSSFSNDGNGVSYTFPVAVPEPATGLLAAIGMGLLLRRRRAA